MTTHYSPAIAWSSADSLNVARGVGSRRQLLDGWRLRRLLCAQVFLTWAALGAVPPRLVVSGPATVHPLETVTVTSIEGARVQVRDGVGHVYWQAPGAAEVTFRAGGALGLQRFEVLDASGRVSGKVEFTLAAETAVSDRGERFAGLFRMIVAILGAKLLEDGMLHVQLETTIVS